MTEVSLRAPLAHGGRGDEVMSPPGARYFFSSDIAQGDRAHALS